MIASLPMYETAPMRAANDRFWAAIRAAFGAGPQRLDRQSDPHKIWLNPDLLLSQTCGMPYRTTLHDVVQLVGTPDYGVAECPPGYYRSHLIVRADDPRGSIAEFNGGILARNDPRSQSGWAAVEAHLRTERLGFSFASNVIETGSHLNSLRAVAARQADIAAIDAVTWALLARDTQDTEGLRVLTSTAPTPGLPLITGSTQDAAALLRAVRLALSKLSKDDRNCLMLRDIIAIPEETYCAVPNR
ncbi:MAG: PhnD/SsuA/transferrin family substrate-binding protein [Roseobacter sp.]